MTVYKIKNIDAGTIAASSTGTSTWTSDSDYVIDKIIVNEKSGTALNDVPASIWIENQTRTKDQMLLPEFQVNYNQAPELSWDLPDNQQFKIDITNNDGASVAIYLDLYLEEA